MRSALGPMLLLLVVLLVLAGMTLRVADRGRYARPFATMGAGPEGARAALDLAERLGLRGALSWTTDLAALPPGGLLVALGDCDRPLPRRPSRYEREALARWVAAGGTLVVAGVPELLGADLGLRIVGPDCGEGTGSLGAILRRPGTPAASRVAAASGRAVGVGPGFDGLSLPWTASADVTVEPLHEPGPSSRAEALGEPVVFLWSEAGGGAEPVGVHRSVGRGWVYALASGRPFQNRELASGGGARLLGRLIERAPRGAGPSGPIRFDDYHQGVGDRRGFVGYLRERGLTPVALQLLLAVALVLWRAGSPFGAPRPPTPAPPPGSGGAVRAQGALYARVGDGAGALAAIARHRLRQARGAGAAEESVPGAPSPKGSGEATSDRRQAALAELEAISALDEPRSRHGQGTGGTVALPGSLAAAVARIDRLADSLGPAPCTPPASPPTTTSRPGARRDGR